MFGRDSQRLIDTNACSSKNCSHLCFAMPNNTAVCSCPDSLHNVGNGSCVCPDGNNMKFKNSKIIIL